MAAPLSRLILVLLFAGCERSLPDTEPATGGDPRRGQALIAQFGCGACHTIPGVPGASATIGPPLQDFRKRMYIAGVATNSAAQLIQWIVDPRELAPNTAMPAVGASPDQARDIAAYLYSR